MERKKLENGRFRRYRGSIFLLAILTISILSLLFLSLAENMKITSFFTIRSKDYYQMAIMKELFLTEYLNYPEEKRPIKGKVIYNTGHILYTYEEPKLKMTAMTSRYQQEYEEQLPITPTEETLESTIESKQLIEESDTVSEEEIIK